MEQGVSELSGSDVDHLRRPPYLAAHSGSTMNCVFNSNSQTLKRLHTKALPYEESPPHSLSRPPYCENRKSKTPATTEAPNGWQPNVLDCVQVAHTPLSMEYRPSRDVKPLN